MSTPRHAKSTAAPTPAAPAQTQAAAAPAPSSNPARVATAVVQSAPPGKDAPRGRGGLYTVQNGRRVLLEQTRQSA